MTGDIRVRPMRPEDLPDVARVHRAAFRGFFLDQMGTGFLRRYYATVLSYEKGVAFVAVDASGAVVGLAAGFMDPAGFYAHFRSRRLSFVPSVALALLRRPTLIGRVLDNSRRVQAGAAPTASVGELASIGVAGRGAGVGSLLLRRFCEAMFERGATSVVLTTDEADNAPAQAFYERRGFRHTGEEARGDRILRRYELAPPG